MNKALIRRSEHIYDFLLKFYPKSYRQEFGEEMKYVFSESLKDAYKENGEQGLISLWTRTLIDAGKSLVTQHLENQKGGESMKTKSNDIIMQNKVFLWIAIATGLILLIPLIGMQISNEWNWSIEDFIIIGILLFGMGSMFVLTARKIRSKRNRVAVGIAFTIAILYIWAELAVGIFTNIGN